MWPGPIVELGGARHARAIGCDRFHAAAHHGEHLVQLAFDERAHRVKLVVQAALFHDFQASSDVLANTFADAERRDAEFKDDHYGAPPNERS